MCVGAELRAAEADPGPLRRWGMRLGVALVALMAVVLIVRGVASVGTSVHEDMVAENRFDPDHFRSYIQEIESALDIGGVDHETSVDLIQSTEFLGNLLDAARPTTPRLAPSVRLSEFQAAAGRLTLSTADEGDLVRLRERWIEIRTSLFREVDWFGDGSREKRAARRRPDDPAREAALQGWEVRNLRDILQIVETTVLTARTRAMYIDEPITDRRSTPGVRQLREWESVTEPVRASLENALGDLPSDRQLSRDGRDLAYELRLAAHEVERLMTGSRVPSRSVRDAAFAKAARHIDRAKSKLDRLTR
jgi:hypothetical protein